MSFLGMVAFFYFITLFNPVGFFVHLIVYALIFAYLEVVKAWILLTALGTLSYFALRWLAPKVWRALKG